MKRFDCLKIAAEDIGDALVISTVGGAAAEWNSIRPGDGNLRCRTLGLVSSIAMGLALALPNRSVVGLDGDGDADERLRLAYAGVAESAQLDVVGFRQRHLRGLGSAAHGNQRRRRLDGHGERGRSEKCFMVNILR
jgi:hypothetical protein